MHPNPDNVRRGHTCTRFLKCVSIEMLWHFVANRAFPGTARQGRCGAVQVWWWDAARRVFRQFAWLEVGSGKLARVPGQRRDCRPPQRK